MMTYPKPLMSITELVEQMGFSRAMLKQYSRATNFPTIRTAGGGKIYVVTEKLDEFLEGQCKRRTSNEKQT